MSLAEDLRLIKIYNPHNLTSSGMPVIWYRAYESRMMISAGWVLTVKDKPFKDVHWQDYGALVFHLYSVNKQEALDQAMAKCKELFPEVEMVKAPWRSTWVTKKDLDAAKAALKEFKKKDHQTEGYINVIRGIGKENE